MGPKKKKTKKDTSKEKELEELKKQQLEEEQRLAEEKQRRDRELQEQRNRELIEQFFDREQSRLNDEALEIQRIVEFKRNELNSILAKIQMEAEWKQFMDCETLPQPKSERDVNTYLGLWAEEKISVEEEPSLTPLFNQLPNAETLLAQLEKERAFARDNRDEKNWVRLDEHMNFLLKILDSKWNCISQQILQHADYFWRDPNENFQLSGKTDNFAYGIWGNLTKNPRHKLIEFTDINLSASLPKPLALSNVSIRMIHMTGPNCGVPFENQENEEHRSFVGGILMLDLAEMPDLPKTVDTWTIRQILSPDGNLKKLEYPFKKAAAEITEEDAQAANDAQMWSTLISFPIPSNVNLDRNSVKVMFWNAEYKMWDDEGITDDDIDLEAGIVKCRTTHFCPTAVVQNTYSELPYCDWRLDPTDVHRAILYIHGKQNKLKIEIREGECMVIQCGSESVPRSLRNKWFPPSLLLKRLSQHGFNFQGPDSMKGVNIEDLVLKYHAAEKESIIGISQCIASMSFKSSPSNRLVSSSKCVFQFKDASDPPETDWRSLVYDVNYRIKDQGHTVGYITSDNNVTEETKFKMGDPENSIVRGSAYHLLRPIITSTEGIARMEASSAQFTSTVAQVLTVTKVLCFT
ncbi:hypothetical protein O5D80_006120 [Batrachochytrium dendrobatidis]|nr:hypothetical protein O5D80_006120 [Batrachochytrium dendrobatidis]